MKEPVIHAEAIQAWANDPRSPLAAELEAIAEQIVVTDAEEALTQEFVGVQGAFLLHPNPPPGPPRYVSGRLYQSIKAVPAEVDNDGLVVWVITDAVNPKSGEAYGTKLLEDGYHFLPERPYYRKDEVASE